jgi:hypothetical protein
MGTPPCPWLVLKEREKVMPDTLVPPEVFTYPEIQAAIMEQHDINNNADILYALYNPIDDINVRRVEIFATLNSKLVEGEYGTCNHCYDPHALYTYSAIHKNNTVASWYSRFYTITEHDDTHSLYNLLSSHPMCKTCIRSRILSVDLFDFNYNLTSNQYITFLPDSIFPSPTTVLDNCHACNHPMLPNTNASNVNRTLTATGFDGEQHQVHGNCAFVCQDCAEHYIYRGSNAASRNLLDNKWVCTGCFNPDDTNFSQCDGCSTYYTGDLIYSNHYDDYRCQSCYDEYVECNDCGYEYQEDDGHDCEESENEGSSYIYNYSYKPSPKFFGDDRIYMGIELEVEASQRRGNLREGAEYVATFGEHNKRLYLKSDGSLNYGFEVVTHPHSLKEYQSLDWSWLNKLRNMGYRSWDASSCGIHVHVGLTAFVNENHQIRFMKFIYDNERQVKRIAGRASTYASFNDKGKVIPKIKNKSHDMNRYSAVNVQNEHTLEVRVFRGSLRKERVLSGIEFVHATTEYTRSLEIVPKAKPFSWARFVAYVASNADMYPNLFTIINETFDNDNTPNDREED